MFDRVLNLSRLGRETCFLWGPRQVGKSTWLEKSFPSSRYYNLLLSDDFARLQKKPSLLREELLENPAPTHTPIIVDEVQKVPALLDEVQWLITHGSYQFILCGSSARKLKRGGGNLLGGRALRFEMFPLISREIPRFRLERALTHGLIPRHYLSDNPTDLIQSYVVDYLKEEIAEEALVRNVPAFHRFLEAAAFSNGEIVNELNIAQECGVSSPTVRQYFEILEDTLLGRFLPVFRKRPKRRVIQSPKFYYFDVGLANFLLKRGPIVAKSESFGKAFEHFLFQELLAHSHYSGLRYPLFYWRTASQLEVDFVLGDHEVAVEVKSTDMAQPRHARGLMAFAEEYKVKKLILVTLDHRPRQMGPVHVLPWADFLARLWDGQIIAA
jgi:predicted AAA+ superfamily ATPase